MEDSTKDYIINLRVSRQTYDKVKSRARKNGQTISNLIRGIIDDSAEIISDISHDLRGPKKEKFGDIVSYHKSVLAQAKTCDNCGTEMLQQTEATVGETLGSKRYYFCNNCR